MQSRKLTYRCGCPVVGAKVEAIAKDVDIRGLEVPSCRGLTVMILSRSRLACVGCPSGSPDGYLPLICPLCPLLRYGQTPLSYSSEADQVDLLPSSSETPLSLPGG